MANKGNIIRVNVELDGRNGHRRQAVEVDFGQFSVNDLSNEDVSERFMDAIALALSSPLHATL